MRILKIIITALAVILILITGFIYLAPETATQFAINIERQRSSLIRKQVDLADGTKIVYLDGGNGEPLLLLHGFGADKDNFTRVARFLTPHYHVIVPDLPGFGESSHFPDADYSPLAQATRLRNFMDSLGVKKLNLGGNSMGGHIALSYAALYPAEVQSLWLLDPAGVWSAPESELQKIIREKGSNPLLARTEDEFAETYKFAMSDPPYIPRPMLNVMAKNRIHNFELEKRIFKQLKADSVEQRITGMSTPALIVWGAQDRGINVTTAVILHKLLSNSQIVIMQGIGHLPMLENPKQSAEDYLKFMTTLK